METPNLLSRVVLSVAVMVGLGACSGSGGGGSSSNNGAVGGALGTVSVGDCASCVNSMQNPTAIDIFNAQNATGFAKLSNMQLIVSGYNTGYNNGYNGGYYNHGYTPGYSSSFSLYSGPVAVQGQFVATTQLVDTNRGYNYYGNYNNAGCVIPAGTYDIVTTSVGNMAWGMLQVPELTTRSGGIRLRISNGTLFKSGGNGPTRLYGRISVISVNGYACSSSFSDTFN